MVVFWYFNTSPSILCTHLTNGTINTLSDISITAKRRGIRDHQLWALCGEGIGRSGRDHQLWALCGEGIGHSGRDHQLWALCGEGIGHSGRDHQLWALCGEHTRPFPRILIFSVEEVCLSVVRNCKSNGGFSLVCAKPLLGNTSCSHSFATCVLKGNKPFKFVFSLGWESVSIDLTRNCRVIQTFGCHLSSETRTVGRKCWLICALLALLFYSYSIFYHPYLILSILSSSKPSFVLSWRKKQIHE